MSDFFRFPHTPHLAWLGQGQPRDDKVLGSQEACELLAHEVVVEEKIDGANVGFSVDENAVLRAQNRGTYLSGDRCHPQFKPLGRWLQAREGVLAEVLFPDLILFGEWCYALHSVRYTRLPDWFLAFDVYDKTRGQFWSVERRTDLVERLGLAQVPLLAAGRFSLAALKQLFRQSRLGDGPGEGIYVRWDDTDWLKARAKLVQPEFAMNIDEHWSGRRLETNRLASETAVRRLQ